MLALCGAPRAEAAGSRLFIQIWWDSPAIEMDPSDDPGRLQVYVGETFVGCAVAPSHLNYRKQLMLVPPSVGFMATGEAAAVKVSVTGHLASLSGQNVRITRVSDVPAGSAELLAQAN